MDFSAEPSPPAPGSHNSELFPELDAQVIPVDLRDQVFTARQVEQSTHRQTGRQTDSQRETDR